MANSTGSGGKASYVAPSFLLTFYYNTKIELGNKLNWKLNHTGYRSEKRDNIDLKYVFLHEFGEFVGEKKQKNINRDYTAYGRGGKYQKAHSHPQSSWMPSCILQQADMLHVYRRKNNNANDQAVLNIP